MKTIDDFNFSMFDNCEKCGCTSYESKNCINQKFYRHIDDKIKMKNNMKVIRNRKVVQFLRIWNKKGKHIVFF